MLRKQRFGTKNRFILAGLLLFILILWANEVNPTVSTRPTLMGTHGAVACGHYLAAEAGMKIMREGGNAIDAGVAQVLAQSVLEYGMFGFGGEVPTIIYSARDKKVYTISGNMVAPKKATIDWFEKNDVLLIPDDGFLPAGVSAVCDAMVTALDRFGTKKFSEVVEPAIRLANDGYPVFLFMKGRIKVAEKKFRELWPTSAALFLPEGKVPEIGQIFRNPDLARTFTRLANAEREALARGATRSEALKSVRDYFYKGPIAREIVKFQKEFKAPDSTGKAWNGLLEVEDFENYSAKIEEPVSVNYKGYDVYKCGPWTQGPVFLQHLNLLEGYDLKAMGHNSAQYIHTWIETAKLAHADKIRYYGDPDFVKVPIKGLLSKEYAAERRKLVDPYKANNDDRPGDPNPYDKSAMRPSKFSMALLNPPQYNAPLPSIGSDYFFTTGTRAIDAQGNMFSATPSGGWFPSSPNIPGLGFCLGTRAQMFYIKRDHPKSIAPGKRPSTSLTPTLVLKDGQPFMALGTPGGDQQDQWTLQVFLNIVDFGMDLQEAVDAPKFDSRNFPSLFYPFRANPGVMTIEGRVSADVIKNLQERGHKTVLSPVPAWIPEKVDPTWTLDYSTVITIDMRTGLIKAGASPRWDTNYAIIW